MKYCTNDTDCTIRDLQGRKMLSQIGLNFI